MTIIDEATTVLNCTDGKKRHKQVYRSSRKDQWKIRTDPGKEQFNRILLSKFEGRAYEIAKSLNVFNWDNLKTA
jgi:hypothetical protein